MPDNSLQDEWNRQYESADETALKDNHLFALEVEALTEAVLTYTPSSRKCRIVELGCGTGALLASLIESLVQSGIDNIEAIGVDFSEVAIEKAKSRNLEFVSFECASFEDFLAISHQPFDIILSQRSIMALMSEDAHAQVLGAIESHLHDDGVAILSECFADAFEHFNTLRNNAGLEPIAKVWHSRHMSETQVASIFGTINYIDFCSSYMLATRLIYPMFEEPVHNSKIHNMARQLPNGGDSSYLKIAVASKRGSATS